MSLMLTAERHHGTTGPTATLICHGSHITLVNHTMPATTRVAAWISADTQEGPSIASGSHPCIPNITHLVLVEEQGSALYRTSAILQ